MYALVISISYTYSKPCINFLKTDDLTVVNFDAGLLAIQNSMSLTDFSGFRNLRMVGTLVIAFLGNNMPDLDGFNSLYQASVFILTRNTVSPIN